MARIPIGMDPDFMNTMPPENAGIAAKIAVQCAATFLPQD